MEFTPLRWNFIKVASNFSPLPSKTPYTRCLHASKQYSCCEHASMLIHTEWSINDVRLIILVSRLYTVRDSHESEIHAPFAQMNCESL